MSSSIWETWPTLVITALGSSGLGAIITHWNQRSREKLKEPADLIRAIGEASESMTDGAKTIMSAFIEEFKFLRSEVSRANSKAIEADQRAARAEIRAEGAEAHAKRSIEEHADCERKLSLMRGQINDMMNQSKIAYYGEQPPKEE